MQYPVQLNLKVTPEQKLFLQKLAYKKKRPYSEIIREQIDKLMEEQHALKK